MSIWEREDDLPDVNPVTSEEGDTPVVPAPCIADDLGVEELLFKDESRNPTGSIHDRAVSVGVSVARDEGAERVTCHAAGDLAVSVACYTARAGIGSKAYVPSRTRFDVKASVNVHGGDMKVVRGNLNDARREADEDDGYAVSSPDDRLRAGYATAAREVAETDPDAVVCPVGTGDLYTAFADELDGVPVHAVQPEGCATLSEEVETPDTVVGELEDPSPPRVDELRATVEANGEAVAVSDGDALDACLDASREGVSVSPAGGVALAGVESLDVSGRVVVLNPALGRLSADALRNRMVYHGE
ncbi:MAG: threonine synthase [Methanobacteriota archaeon]|jgi:threonine synthase|uniref:Pyridoxal-phosphate dependent enzyme n=1 Tax=Halorutilus salinus TaxID=2487751 RepID=A0A9Q4GH77_9EURY|nr:pyridoxal-phosphate dependent enzyme [Halorutilus salinus]MCX2819547.1 pyridoxal-phosphate dependent enzyme [Halorutilus salinus]